MLPPLLPHSSNAVFSTHAGVSRSACSTGWCACAYEAVYALVRVHFTPLCRAHADALTGLKRHEQALSELQKTLRLRQEVYGRHHVCLITNQVRVRVARQAWVHMGAANERARCEPPVYVLVSLCVCVRARACVRVCVCVSQTLQRTFCEVHVLRALPLRAKACMSLPDTCSGQQTLLGQNLRACVVSDMHCVWLFCARRSPSQVSYCT